MKDWVTKKVGDVCEFKYGKNLPEVTRVPGKYPVYGSSSVVSYHNEFLVKGPGVIVGRKGTVGNVQFSKEDFYPIDTTFYITVDTNNVDIKFIYYMLGLCGFQNMNSDAAVPGLNRNAALSVKIRIPTLRIQRRIAKVLSVYDDLIANNLERIKLLEEMAQIAYKEWFVHLRFPNHEHTEIDIETELPVGWSRKKIGSVLAKVPTTKKIQSKDYQMSGAIPVVDQSRSFIAGFTDDSNALLKSIKPLIVFGDHTRILKFINFDFARGADGTQILLSKEPKMPQHLFYVSLLNVDLSDYHYARHFKFLKEIDIVIPSLDVAEAYEEAVEKIYSLVKIIGDENQRLKEARDILLPRLMTGMIDADELIEDAA